MGSTNMSTKQMAKLMAVHTKFMSYGSCMLSSRLAVTQSYLAQAMSSGIAKMRYDAKDKTPIWSAAATTMIL